MLLGSDMRNSLAGTLILFIMGPTVNAGMREQALISGHAILTDGDIL